MRFDFNDTVFSPDGKLDAYQECVFRDGLCDVFVASPEGQSHSRAWSDLSFHSALIHCAHNHLSKDLRDLGPDDLRTILLETLPKKVWVDEGVGAEIVAELRGLWIFLGRQFGAAQADAMVKVLDEPGLAQQIDEAIRDPALEHEPWTLALTSWDSPDEGADDIDLETQWCSAEVSSLAASEEETKLGGSPWPKVKIGRNQRCPCGTGKKYKKCCLN